MTSLQGSLPQSASGLWRMDREYGVSNTRVKHVVIHEAHIRESPDRHVVYRIDVFTTERNWCVYRRYSEFRKLHDKISDSFKMFKGSFPPKQLSGNLSPAIIEQRRSALEHYLLKIINCHNQDVASCNTVLRFLDLHHNDVYYVTSGLCRYVKTFGEAILNESHYFVLSPTQLFCVHKRLRIPNSDADYKADTVFCDLGSLYDFVSRLSKVCIKPASLQDQGIRCELTLLKNIKELHIQTFSVSLVKGLSTVQLQLQRLKACQAVTAMKDLLIDCVLEKKTQPKPPPAVREPVDDTKWRDAYNSKAIYNSYTIHPWISLLYLDLSHNSIRQLDDSFSLLPNLQELDLSYNQIEVLDLNYTNPALTKITCTDSNVMKVITKLHENLSELTLSRNKITELTGFNKLVVLRKLNLVTNCVTSLDNIACLTDLPRLHDIAIADNPLSKGSYRIKVLCMFTQACRRTDILVDGKGFSEKEKRKAKNTRVKGSTPHTPSDLPFFGNSAEHMPTAFAPSQEDLWNSILHDNSITPSVSSSTGEEEEEEEAPLSPVLSDMRSTPSMRAAYDWDPAQAFASSANSTPPIAFPALEYQQGNSRQGSSTCIDKTSSCDDECELGESVKDEDYHSLEKISPLSESNLKQFNCSYYTLSGSTEIYPSTSPNLFGPIQKARSLGTSPKHGVVGCSPKQRSNPFGEPIKKDPATSSGATTSGTSRDGSDSSSDYHTGNIGEGSSRLEDESSSKDYPREDSRDNSREDSRKDASFSSSSHEEKEEDTATREETAITAEVTEGSLDFSTRLPANDTPYRELVSPTSTYYVSPVLTPAFIECGSTGDMLQDEEVGEIATTEIATSEIATSDIATSEIATSDIATNDIATSDIAASPPELAQEAALAEEIKSDAGVESFVVDRPDYDDIIFAGSCKSPDTSVTKCDTVPGPDTVQQSGTENETYSDSAPQTDNAPLLESETQLAVTPHAQQDSVPQNDTETEIDIAHQSHIPSSNVSNQSDTSLQLHTDPQSASLPQEDIAIQNNSDTQSTTILQNRTLHQSDIAPHNNNNHIIASKNTAEATLNPVLPSNSPMLTSNSPVLLSNSPVLLSNSPVLPSNSPMLTSNSPVLHSNSPVLPSNSPVLPSASPVSPSLTDHTSSGDECVRANKIQSLSFSRDTQFTDLYDSEDSEENSEELSFSNTKLQF